MKLAAAVSSVAISRPQKRRGESLEGLALLRPWIAIRL